jgi:hypothetical protein
VATPKISLDQLTMLPTKRDGSTFSSDPTKINLAGSPEVTVDGAGAKASICGTYQGAVILEALGDDPTTVTGSDTTLCTYTITDAFIGEVVVVTFTGAHKHTGSPSDDTTATIKLWKDAAQVGQDIPSTIIDLPNTEQPVSFTYPITMTTSGSVTIKVTGILTAGPPSSSDIIKPAMSLIRLRGAGRNKENLPVIKSMTATTVTYGPQPGWPSTMWVRMNNGLEYYATGTLTLDITTLGLLGRETSSGATMPYATGTGDSLSAPDGSGLQTVTDAAGLFTSAMVNGWLYTNSTSNLYNARNSRIMTYVSATQIKIYNPHGGAETSSFTWYTIFDYWHVYAVPDPGNPGKFSLVASRNPPDYRWTPQGVQYDPGTTKGPSDYSTWAYVGTLFNNKGATACVGLRPLYQMGDIFIYSDASDAHPVFFSGTASGFPSPVEWTGWRGLYVNNTWYSCGCNDTFRCFPPHIASEVKAAVSVATSGAVTGNFSLVVEDGPIVYTPSGFPCPRAICIAQNEDIAHGKDWILCTNGTLRFGMVHYILSASHVLSGYVQGYRDRFLTGRF